MILTDKAKQDFLNYYWDNYIGKTRCVSKKDEAEYFFNSLIKPLKPALIMEWLDSVGVFISIQFIDIFNDNDNKKGFESYVTSNTLTVKFRCVGTRNEAINLALGKANEIYNS